MAHARLVAPLDTDSRHSARGSADVLVAMVLLWIIPVAGAVAAFVLG